MRKANPIHKALLALTLIFVLIAAASFASFRQGRSLCSEASKKGSPAPSKNGGQMLWDDFSRRFLSLASAR